MVRPVPQRTAIDCKTQGDRRGSDASPLRSGAYAAAKVSKPDNDTIICDQVNGQPLRITFKKKIEHWEVRIDVSANKLDEPVPNWVRLMSGRAADEAQRQFWDALSLRASSSQVSWGWGRHRTRCAIQ